MKTFFYLAVLLCFSGDKKDALGSISKVTVLDDVKIAEEKMSLRIEEDTEKIRNHILGLLGQEDAIREEYNDVRYVPKKSKEYSEMDQKELIQELRQLFPSVNFNIPFEDLVRQLDVLNLEIKMDFFSEIKKVYQVEYDFSKLDENDALMIAICIRGSRRHPLLDEFDTIIKKRMISCFSEELGLLYLADRKIDFERLRFQAAYCLDGSFAIKNYLKLLGLE